MGMYANGAPETRGEHERPHDWGWSAAARTFGTELEAIVVAGVVLACKMRQLQCTHEP